MVKDRVPYYKKGELKAIFKSFPQSEKDTIQGFKDYVSIDAGERKIAEVGSSLIQFRDIIDKPFDKVDLEDLRGFLRKLNQAGKTNSTTNQLKGTIKRFLRWRFKDWSIRFDELIDIRMKNPKNEKRLNSSVLLTKEEVEKIVATEPRLKYKTFFMTMYESGCRPNEVRLLRWKDIKLNTEDDLSEIHIFSTKTKSARASYVKGATFFLSQLKKENSPKENDLVFPSPHNQTKELTKGAISLWLKKLSMKAIGREAFPYILRHTRASQLYLNPDIADSIAQKFMGHSKNMKDTYTHMSSKDVKESLIKTIYNFEYVEPEKKEGYEKRIKELEKFVKTQKESNKIVNKCIYEINKLSPIQKNNKYKPIKFDGNKFQTPDGEMDKEEYIKWINGLFEDTKNQIKK